MLSPHLQSHILQYNKTSPAPVVAGQPVLVPRGRAAGGVPRGGGLRAARAAPRRALGLALLPRAPHQGRHLHALRAHRRRQAQMG